MNGAKFDPSPDLFGAAQVHLDPRAANFKLSVIDGQHRINGAYFALMILREKTPGAKIELPAEIFLDLDLPGEKPRRQAQIFIDVNLYQKKVDRSLVADLFPTTRGDEPLDRKDRSQDIGRRLMLEVGPLVGMIQIPGIKYGVKDVVTLSTLNTAIEGAIPALDSCDINNLESQAAFLAQLLDCWLQASGRAENQGISELDPKNVVYQGRILVSAIDLVPAVLARLKQAKIKQFVSENARNSISSWFGDIMDRADLLRNHKFVEKEEFKKLGFLGSGGIGRFRNLLWAATLTNAKFDTNNHDQIAIIAENARGIVNKAIGGYAD